MKLHSHEWCENHLVPRQKFPHKREREREEREQRMYEPAALLCRLAAAAYG